MILLLGATSYIGHAFARALRRRKDAFIPLSKNAFDYTRFEFLFDYVRKVRPDLLINADEQNGVLEWWSDGEAGRGSGGVMERWSNGATKGTKEESERMGMLQANTLLPRTIARVCALTNTPWGHVSSGSIYSGAKIIENGTVRIEEDLSLPSAHALFAAHPEKFHGFTELDEPNFSFKTACTFYSGTKALAEEALHDSRSYVWRLRRPFDEHDQPPNFLSQLQDGLELHDAINSLSHLDDCVNACLELWELRAPFGIYNVVNPGAIRTRHVLEMIRRILKPARQFELLVCKDDAHSNGDKSPCSDCILDSSKLVKTGVKLRPVHDALEKSLEKWQCEPLIHANER